MPMPERLTAKDERRARVGVYGDATVVAMLAEVDALRARVATLEAERDEARRERDEVIAESSADLVEAVRQFSAEQARADRLEAALTERDLRATIAAALTPEHLSGFLEMAQTSQAFSGNPDDCEPGTDLALACRALTEWLTQEIGAKLEVES